MPETDQDRILNLAAKHGFKVSRWQSSRSEESHTEITLTCQAQNDQYDHWYRNIADPTHNSQATPTPPTNRYFARIVPSNPDIAIHQDWDYYIRRENTDGSVMEMRTPETVYGSRADAEDAALSALRRWRDFSIAEELAYDIELEDETVDG